MIDQLFNIVKQIGQDTVVNNPEVPNEYNEQVMADATQTIAHGFQNIMAGGGFQNILDLFKGGSGSASNSGVTGLLKNPIVTMMIGYFISKLVKKYSMSPASASNVANNLIPNALNGLIQQTSDPANKSTTLDGLIQSLVGTQDENEEQPLQSGGFSFQNLLEQFTGNTAGSSNQGFDLQDIIGSLTQKAQSSFQNQQGGGGIMDLIKGFIK